MRHEVFAAGSFCLMAFVLFHAADAFFGFRHDEHDRHEKKCTDARMDFFANCDTTPNTLESCEVMWEQMRSHVFDGDPRVKWTDEVDCSDQVK